MPKGTDAQVGFFVPQSKHTCSRAVSLSSPRSMLDNSAYFIRRLGLDPLEDLEGLGL